MQSGLRRFTTAATAALMVTMSGAFTANAQDVTLRANDGSVTMQGRILEFADGFYRFETELGVLRLSASRMICEGEACPQVADVDADLIIRGSDTVGEGVMPLLVAGYASSLGAEADVQNGPSEGTTVATLIGDEGFGDEIGTYLVASTTSGDGFEGLLNNESSIGMASRRIRPAEARALRAEGGGNMVSVDQERIVAVDPLVTIVNPANSITNLSIEDLRGIFAGEIQNWSEVGGNDAPITVLRRSESSGTGAVFISRALGGGDIRSEAIVVGSHNEMAAMVNDDPNAIGFVGFSFQRGAQPVSLTLQCGILAEATSFGSKTEEYPLARRLYLYARADGLNEQVREFLDYATSAEADGAIAKAGFINLGISRLTGEVSEAKVQSMMGSATDAYERNFATSLVDERVTWDRLSSTFRFASGSSRLDERGRADLDRLVEYLGTQPAGTEVAVVGFTDSDGAFDGNNALSVQRANQLAEELQSAGRGSLNNVNVVTKGYGELAPASCNDTAAGKRINRRVEIWIRGGAEGGVASNG